jgi:hypothetical protein
VAIPKTLLIDLPITKAPFFTDTYRAIASSTNLNQIQLEGGGAFFYSTAPYMISN